MHLINAMQDYAAHLALDTGWLAMCETSQSPEQVWNNPCHVGKETRVMPLTRLRALLAESP